MTRAGDHPFPRAGDDVEVAWGISTVRARVLEVYGPAASRHVLVEVDLGDMGEDKPTVSMPIDEIHPLSTAG